MAELGTADMEETAAPVGREGRAEMAVQEDPVRLYANVSPHATLRRYDLSPFLATDNRV